MYKILPERFAFSFVILTLLFSSSLILANTHKNQIENIQSSIKTGSVKGINNFSQISTYEYLINKIKFPEKKIGDAHYSAPSINLSNKIKSAQKRNIIVNTPMPILNYGQISPTPTTTTQKKIDTQQDYTTVNTVNQSSKQKELFDALNVYRQKNESSALNWHTQLAAFAQERADTFARLGGLDNHAGFREFLDKKTYTQYGFRGAGENSCFGFNLSPVEIIEKIFAGDSLHNNNQLEPSWTNVGIGVNGTAIDVVFGK